MEEWFKIPAFPTYEISSLGNARNNGKVIKVHILRGYLTIYPYKNNKQYNVSIHRFLCEIFHGPAPFPGAQARHLNDNKLDIRKENLCWGTNEQNQIDLRRNNHSPGNAKLDWDKVRKIRSMYPTHSADALALIFKVHDNTIRSIVKGHTWKENTPAAEALATRV